jgi:hypothetical protein
MTFYKVINWIVNNPLSNLIKETFYFIFGIPYPEYIYNDSTSEYVVSYIKGRNEDGETVVEFKTTPEVEYALDTSQMWFWKKRRMLHGVNKTWGIYNGDGVYRFKRILTYR